MTRTSRASPSHATHNLTVLNEKANSFGASQMILQARYAICNSTAHLGGGLVQGRAKEERIMTRRAHGLDDCLPVGQVHRGAMVLKVLKRRLPFVTWQGRIRKAHGIGHPFRAPEAIQRPMPVCNIVLFPQSNLQSLAPVQRRQTRHDLPFVLVVQPGAQRLHEIIDVRACVIENRTSDIGEVGVLVRMQEPADGPDRPDGLQLHDRHLALEAKAAMERRRGDPEAQGPTDDVVVPHALAPATVVPEIARPQPRRDQQRAVVARLEAAHGDLPTRRPRARLQRPVLPARHDAPQRVEEVAVAATRAPRQQREGAAVIDDLVRARPPDAVDVPRQQALAALLLPRHALDGDDVALQRDLGVEHLPRLAEEDARRVVDDDVPGEHGHEARAADELHGRPHAREPRGAAHARDAGQAELGRRAVAQVVDGLRGDVGEEGEREGGAAVDERDGGEDGFFGGVVPLRDAEVVVPELERRRRGACCLTRAAG